MLIETFKALVLQKYYLCACVCVFHPFHFSPFCHRTGAPLNQHSSRVWQEGKICSCWLVCFGSPRCKFPFQLLLPAGENNVEGSIRRSFALSFRRRNTNSQPPLCARAAQSTSSSNNSKWREWARREHNMELVSRFAAETKQTTNVRRKQEHLETNGKTTRPNRELPTNPGQF